MRNYLGACLFIALIIAACSKVDIHTAPLPPPPPKYSEDVIYCGIGPSAEYKGGTAAWMKFLSNNLKWPEDAVSMDYKGTIRVRFVIEKDGTVSNVEASEGPKLFQNEAIRVISLSNGGWLPETTSGHAVRSYKTQPIVFRISED